MVWSAVTLFVLLSFFGLEEELANFFCKAPDSIFSSVSHMISVQLPGCAVEL